MKLTDSDDELHKQLIETVYGVHPAKRVIAHWTMSPAWARRIDAIRIDGIEPVPAWAYRPDKVLLGYPVKVTDDGGAPHMEAEPQREMTPIEPGQEVVYIKCDDPDCPKHKPGLHHAHMDRS